MDVRVGLPIGATEDGVIDTASVQTTDLLPAVWDTGATGTVITQKVVDQLGLSPISMAQVTDANSTRICPVYLVDLHLPNHVVMGGLNVTLQNLGSGLDVLIGMDVITKGDFVVSSAGGNTVMTFRTPSLWSHDFVQDIDRDTANRRSGGRANPPGTQPRNRRSGRRR